MILLLIFAVTNLWGKEPLPAYFIAIKKNDGSYFHKLDQYIPLIPPKNKFYADPFLFSYKGTTYLFFEDFSSHKGVISYVLLDEEGNPSLPSLALKLPTHLSFPYLFQEDNTIFMVPETYQCRSISLYESVHFPNQWKKKRTLLRGEAYSDPILFKHNEYFYLFASIHMTQLVIYYAKTLEDIFIPHPINALQMEGRNAGGIFFMEGKMIRPTMNCKHRYGQSIIFKEIIQLSPEIFEEREIAEIEPTWCLNLLGTHTFSMNDDFIVYDGEGTKNLNVRNTPH